MSKDFSFSRPSVVLLSATPAPARQSLLLYLSCLFVLRRSSPAPVPVSGEVKEPAAGFGWS